MTDVLHIEFLALEDQGSARKIAVRFMLLQALRCRSIAALGAGKSSAVMDLDCFAWVRLLAPSRS